MGTFKTIFSDEIFFALDGVEFNHQVGDITFIINPACTHELLYEVEVIENGKVLQNGNYLTADSINEMINRVDELVHYAKTGEILS